MLCVCYIDVTTQQMGIETFLFSDRLRKIFSCFSNRQFLWSYFSWEKHIFSEAYHFSVQLDKQQQK